MSEKRYQVAICSSAQDLALERSVIAEALAANKCIATGFAFPNPTDPYLWKLAQRAIIDSDFIVILLGNQYGAMSKSGVGYVHQALAQAQVLKKPIFGLIYDGDQKLGLNAQDNLRLLQFQQQLSKYPHNFWQNSEQLRDLVESMVENVMENNQLVGWVHGDKAAPSDKRIAVLKKQMALLDIALKKEREEKLYARGDFIQQDQGFSMPYQCNAFRDGSLIKIDGLAKLTMRNCFDVLAPSLAIGCSLTKIKSSLCSHLQQTELADIQKKVKKAHVITQMQIDEAQLEKLLLALRSYGLVHSSDKQWKLTPFGDHLALKNISLV